MNDWYGKSSRRHPVTPDGASVSPTGALIVALTAIFILGAFAAWLLNVPLWAIGVFLVLGPTLARWAFRRFSRRRARQDTEARL